MKLLNAFAEECARAQATVDNKDDLLKLIANLSAESGKLGELSKEDILKALREREDMDSTGYGNGIAIPHCRLPEADDFVVGLVSLKEGIDFDSIDDEPVHLTAFIVAPDSQSNEHIRILSQISRVLQIPEAVKEMRQASEGDVLRESFLRWAVDEPNSESKSKNLFHVFIQEETLFQEILTIFSSIESSSAFVVETENMSAYLGKLPLFSGFWADSPDRFGRMIVALVAENMTNETIRRIEQVTGKLSEHPGIVVAVQSLFYCDGFAKQ